MNRWWEETVFYQIYMPSFADGNGDGKGDFAGITERLAYLKELGVGGIWLTPFYPSPKVDNGYDIEDYENVDPDYGRLSDFDLFLAEAHRLGLFVIADMVLNHTSDRHPWFQDSVHRRNGRADWYLWEKEVPNNWESFFGQSAWEWSKERGEYYYHSFSKEQVDLNFRNPEVKDEILKVLDFWIKRGVDGFRLDVINNLSTGEVNRDNPYDEKGEQIHLHDVNQEGIEEEIGRIRKRTEQSGEKQLFLVGEISSDELPVIRRYVGENLLHTTFNFNLGSMESFTVDQFFTQICEMQRLYRESYPTLFFGSHDMRRFASRFQMEEDSIKVLAAFVLTFRGIAFLYYGEELGMRDKEYRGLEDAKDCQAVIAYEEAIKSGKNEQEALEAMRKKGRDYSRGMMDWESAERQTKEADSLFASYQELIKLRKDHPVFQTGALSLPERDGEVIWYDRTLGENRCRVILNFSGNDWKCSFAGQLGKLLYPAAGSGKKAEVEADSGKKTEVAADSGKKQEVEADLGMKQEAEAEKNLQAGVVPARSARIYWM